MRYGELLQKGEPSYHHVCLMSVYMKYVAAMKNENQLSLLKVKQVSSPLMTFCHHFRLYEA